LLRMCAFVLFRCYFCSFCAYIFGFIVPSEKSDLAKVGWGALYDSASLKIYHVIFDIYSVIKRGHMWYRNVFFFWLWCCSSKLSRLCISHVNNMQMTCVNSLW
jgi:hypothetical protein